MNRKVVTFVSLVLLAVLAIGQVFTAGRGFSELENRYLESAPKLEGDAISSGEWMERLERYLADHVPGRDTWVQLKNSVVRMSGRDQIGQVVFAEDRLIQVQDISLKQLEKNVGFISELAESLPADIPMTVMVAPNANWVYQELLPDNTQSYDPEKAAELLEEQLSDRLQLVMPIKVLEEHKDEAIYFKSDHHWTMRGAAYAWEELAAALGVNADPFAYEAVTMGKDFKGSLYSQAPVYSFEGENFEVFQVPGLDAKWSTDLDSGAVLMKERFQEKDQYTAFFGGNYGLVRIQNETAQSHEKLLILKDSYANILVPFLIEEYREIIMVDLRHYKGSVRALTEAESVDRIVAVYNLDFLCTDGNFAWMGV
ncbi:MAG: hypothetical protein IKL38_02835 [Firmicutes bacterium]|nr:hypothetical protein [Bacillota bacterium]